MHFLLCGIYVRSILHGLLILNSAFHTAEIHFMSYEINIINVLSLCTFDALLCSALISFVGTDERNRGRRMTIACWNIYINNSIHEKPVLL
jgi:hypothetical protein